MPSHRLTRLAELLELNLKCEICEKPFKNLREIKVDHDHVTDKARGILCNHCNIALGFFRDNPKAIFRALKYLRVGREMVIDARQDLKMAITPRAEMLNGGQVAALMNLQPQDVWRASRKEDGFHQGAYFWLRRDVDEWIPTNREQLNEIRTRYDKQREATAARVLERKRIGQ
jgi:hypothetical protein